VKKIITLIILLSISIASAKSYYYDSINVNVTVLDNGDLTVVEAETLVFDGQYSYVYRDFNSLVYNLQVSGDYTSLEQSGTKYTIRGDWVDTAKTFIFTYTIKDPLTITRDYDQLYYTIVFWDRDVPVSRSEAIFNFPNNINGSAYRTNRGTVTKLDDKTLMLLATDIPSNSAFDFEINLPKGVITPQDNWKNFASMNQEIMNTIIITPLILLNLLTIYGLIKYYKLKKEKDKSLVAYERINPESLPPAMAGLLVNFNASVRGITATIIDLAVKGYIYIHKIIKPLWPDETILVKVKDGLSRLNDYEQLIMNTIFNKKKEVSLSELRYKFNPQFKAYDETPLKKILDLMQDEAVKLGLADDKINKLITNNTLRLIVWPLTSIILTILYTIITNDYTNGITISITLTTIFIGIIGLIILSALSTNLIKLTSKGESGRQEYKDLKEFIKKSPLTEGRIFDTYLPYAIALGVQKYWVKKANELEYQSSWHDNNISTMSIIALTSVMNTSVMPASSGGGAGGFGGGGGAGGGGGGAG
jgi:uncharacterized membrane protein